MVVSAPFFLPRDMIKKGNVLKIENVLVDCANSKLDFYMYNTNMHSLEERENILLPIKIHLKKLLKENIVSAVVYGSSLSDDYCFLSDIDILIVLKIADNESLKILRKIKEKYDSSGFDLDFNVHTYNETPKRRKETFWHNNRSLYMQIELSMYGRQLIGKNSFENKNINLDDLRLEVVRVISSLTYQARKLLVNSDLNAKKRITMMKWCIYGVMYYLAFWKIYPETRKEASQTFHKMFPQKIDPSIFLEYKSEHTNDITMSGLSMAYNFLSELQLSITKEYRKIYGTRK